MPDFNLFPQIVIALPGATGAVVRKVAAAVQTEAKDRAAVDTGFMRDSIHIKMQSETEALVIAGAYYSIYVEMGTRHMAAQPFMAPAADAVRSNLDSIIGSIEGDLL